MPRGQEGGKPNFRGRDAIHEFNTVRFFAHSQSFPTNLRVLRLRVPGGSHVANILFLFPQSSSGHTGLFLPGMPAGFSNQDLHHTKSHFDFETYRWAQGAVSVQSENIADNRTHV
jgi:hypothetical protein